MCNSLIINRILMFLIFMVNQDKTKIKKQYDLFTINDKLIDSLIEKAEVNDNSFDWYIRCSKNSINDRYLLLSIDVTKEDILKHPSIKEEYRSLI